MIAERKCCCMDIKTCGIILGVIGTIFGFLVCIASSVVYILLPWAIFLLLTYICLLYGIKNKSASCLLAAENSCFQVAATLMAISFVLCFAFAVTDLSTLIPSMKGFQYWVYLIVMGFVIFVILVFGCYIYSYIVIHRVRKLIEEENALTIFIPQQDVPLGNVCSLKAPQQNIPSSSAPLEPNPD